MAPAALCDAYAFAPGSLLASANSIWSSRIIARIPGDAIDVSGRSLVDRRDHALNGRTAYPLARTNRLKRVLAQICRAHQRPNACRRHLFS